MGIFHTSEGPLCVCESGPESLLRHDIIWLYSSDIHTNMSRGTHPSSPMFLVDESNSIMSQHVCVYPYCSEAWFNSSEIWDGIGRCCVDLCDPVSSIVMICVCSGLLRRRNTGSIFSSCLARE